MLQSPTTLEDITLKKFKQAHYPKIVIFLLTMTIVIVPILLSYSVAKKSYSIASNHALEQASTLALQLVRMTREKIKPEGRETSREVILEDFRGVICSDPSLDSLNGYDLLVFYPTADRGYEDLSEILKCKTNPIALDKTSADRSIIAEKIRTDNFDNNLTRMNWAHTNKSILYSTEWSEEDMPNNSLTLALVPTKMWSIRGFDYKGNVGILAVSRQSVRLDGQSTDIRIHFQNIAPWFALFVLTCLLCILIIYRYLVRFGRKIAEGEVAKRNDHLWQQFSHDVRAPLVNIKGAAKKLYAKDELCNDVLRILKSEEQIREALDYQELESRLYKSGIALTSIQNIKSLILQCVQSHAIKEKRRRKKCQISLQEIQSCSLVGNETFIYRVLQNLLNNAIDFSPNGIIEIQAIVEGDWYSITILDSGVGISEKVKASFGKEISFPREDGDRGKGKGLVIVESIMKKHKGEFDWPKNRPGTRGSKVVVRFPINNSNS